MFCRRIRRRAERMHREAEVRQRADPYPLRVSLHVPLPCSDPRSAERRRRGRGTEARPGRGPASARTARAATAWRRRDPDRARVSETRSRNGAKNRKRFGIRAEFEKGLAPLLVKRGSSKSRCGPEGRMLDAERSKPSASLQVSRWASQGHTTTAFEDQLLRVPILVWIHRLPNFCQNATKQTEHVAYVRASRAAGRVGCLPWKGR